MKKIAVLAITAALCLGMSTAASAIDFKAKGNWQLGTILNQKSFVKESGGKNQDIQDKFNARNRIRLQIDAVASESLSGTVYFEIGHMWWGNANNGASLGADGTIVKVRMAYMDWIVPNTDLKLRMGIQNVSMPQKAGGGAVLDNMDVAGIVASYAINDNVSLTAMWLRPFNDNYPGGTGADGRSVGSEQNLYDNMDLFGLAVPLRFDGVTVAPWALYGIRGKNTFTANKKLWNDSNPYSTLGAYPFGPRGTQTGAGSGFDATNAGNNYGGMFFAGLPVGITALDPWNFEFELDYGYVEGMGRYSAKQYGKEAVRGSTERKGWLAKGLIEYKLDWGTPGIFGWYGSGDDGDIKNGSERMPSLRPNGKFTSMFGDDVHYGGFNDQRLSYSGTWGLGAQIKNLTFVKDLKHTARVAYWGGTNSEGMVKYATKRTDWNSYNDYEGVYLTTKDGMLEFNLNSEYKIYDNLSVGLGLGYVVNMMSPDVWQESSKTWLGAGYSKQDIWKADLTFKYQF